MSAYVNIWIGLEKIIYHECVWMNIECRDSRGPRWWALWSEPEVRDDISVCSFAIECRLSECLYAPSRFCLFSKRANRFALMNWTEQTDLKRYFFFSSFPPGRVSVWKSVILLSNRDKSLSKSSSSKRKERRRLVWNQFAPWFKISFSKRKKESVKAASHCGLPCVSIVCM